LALVDVAAVWLDALFHTEDCGCDKSWAKGLVLENPLSEVLPNGRVCGVILPNPPLLVPNPRVGFPPNPNVDDGVVAVVVSLVVVGSMVMVVSVVVVVVVLVAVAVRNPGKDTEDPKIGTVVVVLEDDSGGGVVSVLVVLGVEVAMGLEVLVFDVTSETWANGFLIVSFSLLF
jgi:hypothetical protein